MYLNKRPTQFSERSTSSYQITIYQDPAKDSSKENEDEETTYTYYRNNYTGVRNNCSERETAKQEEENKTDQDRQDQEKQIERTL